MSKKDYIVIAAAIKAITDRLGDSTEHIVASEIVQSIARAMKQDNARFNVEQFRKDCGY